MRCVEQPQLLKLMVDVAADHMTQNFMKGKEEVLKDFKVTDLKCKGGTPMPMSVKEGTIKRDRESKRVAKESRAKLKGSIGEGPNHSNFSDQSSVKITSNFSTSCEKIQKIQD